MIDESDDKVAQDHRAADRLLVQSSRVARSSLVVLGVTALVLACADTALPALIGRAVDAVFADASRSWLVWCGLVVTVVVVADVVGDLAAGHTTARSTAWLRHSLLRRVLDLGPKTGRMSTGDVASRMVGNAAAAGKGTADIVRAAADIVPSVGGIVALALIDPWLCVTFLAGLPVLVLLLRSFVRDASSMAIGYLETQAGIASRLMDALSGARTIAAAGTADREMRRVLQPLPQLQRYGMGMWRAQLRIGAQDALLLPLLEVLVLAVAGFELSSGRISVGEMLAAGQYVQLASTVGSAANTLNRLARARAGAARVAEVLAQAPPVYGSRALPPGPGRIEFRDVTVRSEGRPVIENVSFVLPGGALVAVVGRSGSGKSLLAALVGRLADPDEGTVLLDGVALPSLTLDQLRREVTYGFERPALIGDTIDDVIAFGAGTVPSEEQIVVAACVAQADQFIRHLPAGYRTPLADAPMSGGEAQRMGLARTFAHAGRVVVLDDVAASLDTVTEHQISRVLTGRFGDRTRLVVAHRASTAARAELVVWLDGGRVRAVEPHEALWGDPEYRALFGPDPGASVEAIEVSKGAA